MRIEIVSADFTAFSQPHAYQKKVPKILLPFLLEITAVD